MATRTETNNRTRKQNLLIPHKRALLRVRSSSAILPPRTDETHPSSSSSEATTLIVTELNPSSRPAGMQFRRPAFSSLPSTSEGDKSDPGGESHDDKTIEFDGSLAPQPFLEIDVLERLRERRERERERERSRGGGEGGCSASADGQGQVGRQGQGEYGSMAIKGRIGSVRGTARILPGRRKSDRVQHR